MPSFGDTALIALIALLLFGPKKLPELARQLGKLMGEFRRASNEFRMQMEDELRIAEQAERQQKIAAMEAAAPVAPTLLQNESTAVEATENTIAAPTDAVAEAEKPERHTGEPLPIATAGELEMMPPSTGLPTSRSPIAPVLDAIPHTADPDAATHSLAEERSNEALHG
ncbi:twin-arginine translocase TatA/TatE family subunit [Granulicella arctica]|uniref:Sec-independent protein translocase protein TatB n=1 Tax=Granulicella arctica TaxID=940613 RepID=A0A7Y9PGY0_9BACT|nr:twin-arginine translocase TatA/TatE family subunit [Granulicella arctica]NYF79515.1 sec-independent protein translocase protein TatB [Granulicella arctica]